MRPLHVFLVFVAAIALCGDVYAQSGGPSSADKETARSLFKAGNDSFEAKDYDGALRSFAGADSIMRVPSTALMVGRALDKLGRLTEASDALARALLYPKKADESRILIQARKDARKLADAIAARIPTLTINIAGVIEGTPTAITLDGHALPSNAASLPRKVDPGTHDVTASATGYFEASKTVTIDERANETITLTLERDPSALLAPTASAQTNDAGADSGDDGDDPPETDAAVSPLVYVGFITAGVGVILGAITGGMAIGKSSDVSDQCADGVCPTSAEADNDSARTLAHVSTIGFAVGGAGAVLGIIGLLISDFDADQEGDSASLSPYLGYGTIGVIGRF